MLKIAKTMKVINIFGMQISTYLILILSSLFINGIISIYLLEKTNINRKHYLGLLIFETIGICTGAKILDFLIYYKYYTNIVEILFRGYIFYGGIICGIFMIYAYSKFLKLDIKEVFNVFIPNFLIIYSICKIGCFFNECCGGINQFPIQLLESLLCFIIYVILMFKREKYIKENKMITISCFSYSIIRLILEFFREDKTAKVFFGLTISQILSICVIVLIICLLDNGDKREKK